MRFLVLSDVVWDSEGVVLDRLQCLVRRHSPDAVLLAGDLVDNDKFGHRRVLWRRLYEFLESLGRLGIEAFAARGNWDEPRGYARACRLRGASDISERLVSYRGVKLLGVSNAATKDLRYMRDIAQRYRGPIDIVLAHAQYGRRPWLFTLNTRLIITGHFDIRLASINGTGFISLWNSPGQYALVEVRGSDWNATLFYRDGMGCRIPQEPRAKRKLYRLLDHIQRTGSAAKVLASCSGGECRRRATSPVFGLLSTCTNSQYAREVRALLRARARVSRNPSRREEEMKRLRTIGVATGTATEFLRCARRGENQGQPPDFRVLLGHGTRESLSRCHNRRFLTQRHSRL